MERKQYLTIILTLIITVALILVAFEFNLFNPNSKQNEIEVTSNPLLWKIEGENPSYLYGSIHVGTEEILTLPDVVMNAIDEVDVVYTEVKFDEEMQTQTLYLSLLPAGQTLEGILPQDVANSLNSYLNTKDLSLTAFNSFKIWVVVTSLLRIEYPEYFLKPALDQYVWNIAINKGKDTNGLETVEEQIGIFDGLTLKEQIQLLNDSLTGLNEDLIDGEDPIDTIINAYLEGDLETFQEIEYQDYNVSDPLYEKLLRQILTDRNYNMTQRISYLITNNPDTQYFFTIGSAHYYGEDGLITLLENKGYNVTRVPFNECASCDCDKDETKIKDRCYIPYEK